MKNGFPVSGKLAIAKIMKIDFLISLSGNIGFFDKSVSSAFIKKAKSPERGYRKWTSLRRPKINFLFIFDHCWT